MFSKCSLIGYMNKNEWFRAVFFKEVSDVGLGWRVPRKLRNPEQPFMTPLVQHTWERLELSLPFHLLSLQSCIVGKQLGPPDSTPTSQLYFLICSQCSFFKKKKQTNYNYSSDALVTSGQSPQPLPFLLLSLHSLTSLCSCHHQPLFFLPFASFPERILISSLP